MRTIAKRSISVTSTSEEKVRTTNDKIASIVAIKNLRNTNVTTALRPRHPPAANFLRVSALLVKFSSLKRCNNFFIKPICVSVLALALFSARSAISARNCSLRSASCCESILIRFFLLSRLRKGRAMARNTESVPMKLSVTISVSISKKSGISLITP